ncbi:MAG: hypothetical protein KDD60_11510, partial [Bdellovibrionales bacterium]|nr:hypothetical protein [Bdellovibrionales bacterium]
MLNSLKRFVISLAKDRIPILRANLDECPAFGSGESRVQRISGWAFAPSELVALEFRLKGQLLERFYPALHRPDVAQCFSEVQSAYVSGFSRELPREAFSALNRHGAELVARSRWQTKRLWTGAGSFTDEELARRELQKWFPSAKHAFALSFEPARALSIVVTGPLSPDARSLLYELSHSDIPTRVRAIWIPEFLEDQISEFQRQWKVPIHLFHSEMCWEGFVAEHSLYNDLVLCMTGGEVVSFSELQ